MYITGKDLMNVIFVLLYFTFTVDVKYTRNKTQISNLREY